MYKYEMDPTRTVGATEQTRDAGRTDGVKPIYPTITLLYKPVETLYKDHLSYQDGLKCQVVSPKGEINMICGLRQQNFVFFVKVSWCLHCI